MSDSSVLKEFLVSLSFKVDRSQQRRFNSGLNEATKAVKGFAVALTAMAATTAIGIKKVAEDFEALYFASQRIGDSAGDIKAFGFAVGQMGGDAKAAQASLESMSRIFRNNPGFVGYFRGITGKSATDANGQMRGMVDLANELSQSLKNMPPWRASQLANQFGIDESTLHALVRGTEEYQKKRKELAAAIGVDSEKAAEAGKNFMQSWRDLELGVTLVVQKVLMVIEPFVKKAIDGLTALGEATGGLSTMLIGLAVALGPIIWLGGTMVGIFVAIGVGLAALTYDFLQWKKGAKSFLDWSAWSSEIDRAYSSFGELKSALKELGLALYEVWKIFQPFAEWFIERLIPIISTVADLSITNLIFVLKTLANIIQFIVAILTFDFTKAWKLAGNAAKDFFSGVIGLAQKLWGVVVAIQDVFRSDKDRKGLSTDNTSQQQRSKTPASVPRAANENVRNIAGYITDYFVRSGVHPEAAKGAVAGLYSESKLDPNAVGPVIQGRVKVGAEGLAQWLGPRRKELHKRYGKNSTLDQQLEFILWELRGGDAGGRSVLSQTNAEGALRAYVTKFARSSSEEQPQGIARGMAYLQRQKDTPLSSNPMKYARPNFGGGVAPINNTITFNVDGSKNPEETARMIRQEQDRVNDRLLRQAGRKLT